MSFPKIDELLKLWWDQAREFALIVLDPNGVVLVWGGEAEAIFGYQADEIIGKSADLLFTPEDVREGRTAERAADC